MSAAADRAIKLPSGESIPVFGRQRLSGEIGLARGLGRAEWTPGSTSSSRR